MDNISNNQIPVVNCKTIKKETEMDPQNTFVPTHRVRISSFGNDASSDVFLDFHQIWYRKTSEIKSLDFPTYIANEQIWSQTMVIVVPLNFKELKLIVKEKIQYFSIGTSSILPREINMKKTKITYADWKF